MRLSPARVSLSAGIPSGWASATSSRLKGHRQSSVTSKTIRSIFSKSWPFHVAGPPASQLLGYTPSPKLPSSPTLKKIKSHAKVIGACAKKPLILHLLLKVGVVSGFRELKCGEHRDLYLTSVPDLQPDTQSGKYFSCE